MRSRFFLCLFVAMVILVGVAGVRGLQAETPYPAGELLLNDPTYGPLHQAVLKALGEEHVSKDRASLLFGLQGGAERSGLPVKRILDCLQIGLANAKEKGQTPLQAVQSLAEGLERKPPFGDVTAPAETGVAKKDEVQAPSALPERWRTAARELIEAAVADMPKPGGPDVTIGDYITLAKAWSMVGNAAKAKAAFESARALAADRDKPEDQATDYVDIAQAQADGGYSAEASKTIADAKAALSKADRGSQIAYFALSNLAVAQAKAKDVDGAMATARRVASRRDMVGVDDQICMTYTGVAVARAKAGDVDGARTTAKLIANKEDAARAMAEVAGELAKSTKYRDAMATAEQIEDKSARGTAYPWIACAAADAGDLQEASAAARALAGDAILVAEPWASMAAAQVRQKDVAGAKAATAKVQDDRARQFVVARIAAAQAEAGDLAGAQDVAASLKEEGAQDEALAAIAEAQAAKGDTPGALATAAKIANQYQKSRVPACVAKWQARAGDTKAAMATIRKAATDGSSFWRVSLQVAVEVAGMK